MREGVDREPVDTAAEQVVASRRGARMLIVTGVGATGVLAVLAAGANLLDTGLYAQAGIPVAATGVQVPVAVLRLVVTVSSAVSLGSLLYSTFLVPAQASGTLDVDGYRAVRRAGWSAAVAGIGALLLAAWTAADLTGRTVAAVLTSPDLLSAGAALEEPIGWLLMGAGFCAVALGCAWTLSLRAAGLLAALATVSLVPPPETGQAAVGRGYDWASDSATLQALGLAVWLGVLVAAVAHRWHHGGLDDRLWRRARIFLICGGAVWLLGTAVLSPLLTIPGSITGTAWGRWQLVEAVLVVLAAAIWFTTGRRGRGLVPLAVLTGLVVVVSGAMAHAVPPRFLARADSPGEILIGYDLPERFTALRALLDWRLNLLFTVVTVVAVALYLRGVRVLRARGDIWERGRTAAWICGWVVVVLATSSGIGRFAAGMFSVHMISHMSLNMLAPVLLVLGGPITLALRVLPSAGDGKPAGPREWVADAVASPAARLATHPFVTLTLFTSSFYLLYFTGLFESSLRFHWGHQLMIIYIMVVGYLFFWPLVGVDHAPIRLPHLGRLGVLLAAMPFHTFFGVALMSKDEVIGESFYRSLALPWLPDLLADQKVGGGIAWASGEVPVLVVVIALLIQWAREDERSAARHDRRAARDDEADLRAYNEMFTRLAQRRQ